MWLELGFEGEVGACLDKDCGVFDIEGDSSTTHILSMLKPADYHYIDGYYIV